MEVKGYYLLCLRWRRRKEWIWTEYRFVCRTISHRVVSRRRLDDFVLPLFCFAQFIVTSIGGEKMTKLSFSYLVPGSHHLAKFIVASTASNCSHKWLHDSLRGQKLQPRIPMGSPWVHPRMEYCILHEPKWVNPGWTQKTGGCNSFQMGEPSVNPKILENAIICHNFYALMAVPALFLSTWFRTFH